MSLRFLVVRPQLVFAVVARREHGLELRLEPRHVCGSCHGRAAASATFSSS